MATPILNATSGSATANTYCTLVEANAYYDMRLHRTNWEGSYADEQNRALLMSTRILDEHFNWIGCKYTVEQSLRWPRSSVLTPDGYDVDYTTIPQFLKNATAELAGYLIFEDKTVESDTKGFSRLKADVLEMVIDKTDRAGVIPDSVYNMLKFYGELSTNLNTKLLRV